MLQAIKTIYIKLFNPKLLCLLQRYLIDSINDENPIVEVNRNIRESVDLSPSSSIEFFEIHCPEDEELSEIASQIYNEACGIKNQERQINQNMIRDEMPHYVPMYSNWIDGIIPNHVESLIIIPKEETQEAVKSLATVCEKYKVTEEVLVTSISEEQYRLKYKET